MTVPKRRSALREQHAKWNSLVALQNHHHGRSGRAQSVFFMALFVAAVLFLNNVTHLGDVPSPLDEIDASSQRQGYKPSAIGSLLPDHQTPPDPPKMQVPPPAANNNNNNNNNPDVSVAAAAAAGGGGDDNAPVMDESGVVGEAGNSEAAVATSVASAASATDTAAAGGDGNGNADTNDNKNKIILDGLKSRQEQYARFQAEIGILSETPFSTHQAKHQEIDAFENTKRCRRYGYTYSKTEQSPRNRRIFYGAVMADEPWELLEIVAAESYGIFQAMVLIEPDKDIYGQPREPLRLEATALLRSMFGVENIKIIKYSNNDDKVKGELLYDLAREEIVPAWKDLGMTVNDVGYMSAIDDVFARDYLRAIQYCELPEMKYELHHCLHNRVKTFGNCQVYETSPDCVSRTKKYEHPDMMIGACIKGIGNETLHRIAPRDKETGVYREKGWNCEDRSQEKDIKDQKFPLWTGTDIRQLCGGRQANLRAAMHQQYSAFHFRNFYNTARDMRLKYTTEEEMYDKSMDDLGEDMRVTYRCIKDIQDEQNAVIKREPGGFKVLKPVTPIYFADETYREAAHERAKKKILDDEKNVKADAKPKKAPVETKKETKKKDTTTKTDPNKDLKQDTKKKKTTTKKK